MAVSLARFSWWYWGGKEKETGSSSDWGLGLKKEQTKDAMKFSSVKKKEAKMASSSSGKKVRRKWQRRKKVIDKEYDIVLVPSDGVSLSGSEESDDSDWSIGWMEPHAPDFFQSEDEDNDADNSFAVLVPCYRNDSNGKEVEQEPGGLFLTALSNLPNDLSAGGNKHMEQWLSSLQNF